MHQITTLRGPTSDGIALRLEDWGFVMEIREEGNMVEEGKLK